MYLVGAPHPDKAYARQVLDGIPSLSARDALHVAAMRRRDVTRIMSFHTGSDQVAGLSRIPAHPQRAP